MQRLIVLMLITLVPRSSAFAVRGACAYLARPLSHTVGDIGARALRTCAPMGGRGRPPAGVAFGQGGVGVGVRGLHASGALHQGKVDEIEAQLKADDPTQTQLGGEERINLWSLSPPALEELLVSWGAKKFVAKQVHQWMYEKGATNIDDFTNVSKQMREMLKSKATLGTLSIATQQESKDGTIKRAYALPDGQLIESVLMPYNDGRRTACISSQAGCAMGCVFCATGQMGFARQLTASEIFEQVLRFHCELAQKGERLSNVVLMGMGEPLGNYNNVLTAVRRMNEEVGIGARHITISTVGLVPRIQRLSKEGLQVKLAVSLHAANDRERSEMMPVNVRFPLSELMQACRDYIRDTGRRITFEWALIAGKNDTPETAHELGALLQGMMCHVNLIPLNPTSGFDGKPTQAADVKTFVEVLAEYGVTATPRVRRGIDIDAGCGQLKSKVQKALGRGGAPL
uniref:Radical SAM core domain-containing protein n=1 Tax=Hemiselmis andersenii TaxID=464988 RepID=A0A7S1DYM6_HEMAN|mmetsp:Transcript_32234/g.78623  ORF Transcript_32234/g.78623 Transcript_32234/m.78623 type:complete len:458 (+) Transcript_32234:25-1398(+)